MCGEKRCSYTLRQSVAGSPPRVRGKVFTLSKSARLLRITPACAGKRSGRSRILDRRKDHPRVCVEKLLDKAADRLEQGSPPRVRGKATMQRGGRGWTRITPACAGKSRWSTIRHTRSRGSPPRVRGKVACRRWMRREHWITPACAGKRLKKAHKIKDFDPVPIRFHLVFRRFERWCSNLPTLDGNVPV